jgi:AcrR family transcriptional regulator
VPTGVALRDVREQLFDAAERVLLRDGPHALTSRAVTTEAGVSKGVLHRHFADLDAFLAEFVRDRVGRLDRRVADLRDSAGSGRVVDNLTDALTALYASTAVAVVGLVSARDGLRERLRETWPAGVPVITEAITAIASYLLRERELGRIAADTDVETLATMLIGTTHLIYVHRDETPPDAEAVRRIVMTAITATLRDVP